MLPGHTARRAANYPGVPSVAMSALAIHRSTRRLRGHTAAVLVVLALGALIAVHHSTLAGGDMHHAGMGTVIELCLGVFTAVGVAVAAIALGLRRLGRWDTPARRLPLGIRLVPRGLTLEPRAGPPGQPLLCVWRR
jgi:hypothetical protein